MHPNPVFRQAETQANLAFARERGFGTIAINGQEGPLLSHVPFVLIDDQTADMHFVRSNPISRADGGRAVLSVQGPDGYVSPDWYGLDDQVPTWNYVAVHLRGTLAPLPDAALHDTLVRLSAEFERRLAPKPAWLIDKVSDDHLRRLMRMIRPFRLDIEAVDGTWKLGQNKPAVARTSAATGMEEAPIGQEVPTMAALMRGVDSGEPPS